MPAQSSARGLPTGFLSRLARSAGRVIGWRPGHYEVADPTAVAPGAFTPAEPEPEHIHHSRYSLEELDAAIENSIRTGDADLDAAFRRGDSSFFDLSKSRWGKLRRKKARPSEPAPREAKAFGGDLYPTAAHTTGEGVRYVKVSTWSSGRKPAADRSAPG